MKLYKDADADLALLANKTIAVIGYGNQGRAQALNLRDSGLSVTIGNRADEYAARAKADRFAIHAIGDAVARAGVVMLLIPDEVMPGVFRDEIAPRLRPGAALVFASGYTVAFGLIEPPPSVDVVLLAPRMIGAGVRDLFVAGRGFPSFIGVAQDVSGQARALALALAKGIGSTRAGVVEVTFAQEAELDLFTEQCFGPAFGSVLTSAVTLLLDEGYPPEAVLLELYMSGEFAYTLGKIAELGLVEQAALHSTTSQYGSLSRGLRFQIPELRARLREGLDEIRSGAFAREWAEEQAEGAPTLAVLRESAREMPLYALERQLREVLQSGGPAGPPLLSGAPPSGTAPGARTPARRRALIGRLRALMGRLLGRSRGASAATASQRSPADDVPARLDVDPHPHEDAPAALGAELMARVIRAFVADAASDPALLLFARDRTLTSAYRLTDIGVMLSLRFAGGAVVGALEPPPEPPQVQLSLTAAVFDGMLSGRINATRAALAGDIAFDGETRAALTLQRVQRDLIRVYRQARERVLAEEAGTL